MLLPQFQRHPLRFFTSPFKPTTQFKPFDSPRFLSTARVFRQPDGETDDVAKVRLLKEKIEVAGINCDFTSPGQYIHIVCPKCKGGKSVESSLSFHINQNKDFAMWRCFRIECGWAGKVFADISTIPNGANQLSKVSSPGRLTEESLRLESLGDELAAYFAERMISKEVLRKNAVMQLSTEKNVIAFTYRTNGVLVNCKYRSIMNKKFWQEKGAKKILYGLDDIKDADEIVIVEGEIDKLSVEQAGLSNSVSVPDGAPQKVSTKELPSLDKDTRFQYLWNCKEYLDKKEPHLPVFLFQKKSPIFIDDIIKCHVVLKASRIILATDGDGPGQVLAEELARRLGQERCWQVRWPKKDGSSCFKDANEVLKNLGAGALREIIENAELYEVPNLKQSQLK